ncbi:hypothetical protein GBK04_25085 [Cytophagaceae bacterium SJW1-29]|uniref:Uncharacterized protein n=2 Tax=Salmonirosea aquatica TaxID=2654236 RepID=A0A7C9BKY1_9BACT|nr:hypothetical protein [Cytophagaceae bacterium SJW1-29]
MKDDDREAMIRESRACMSVKFHNNPKSMLFWSKCNQRKQHRSLSDAVNYLMWLVNEYKDWQGCVATAAIFDTRSDKGTSASNKMYQYERGRWELMENATF